MIGRATNKHYLLFTGGNGSAHERSDSCRTALPASCWPAVKVDAWAASTRDSCCCKVVPMVNTPRSFAPQVDDIVINAKSRARRNVPRSAIRWWRMPSVASSAHWPVCTRAHACVTRRGRTVPCDSPFLPTDLVKRLRNALENQATRTSRLREHRPAAPVFALVRRQCLPHLTRYLEGGGRKIDAWYATLKPSRWRSTTKPMRFATSTPPTSSGSPMPIPIRKR